MPALDPSSRTDRTDVPAHWVPAVRVDVGRLRKAERTDAGGVRVPGAVAKAGILEYRRTDGSTVRELVLPEEVKRADALASLRDAPVTVGHPDGGKRLVSPETYRHDAAGHVSGEARVEGDHLVADLVIQEADAIRRVDAGELSEISAGYRVLIDPTPGETADGQRYDAIQRRRRYNHVALVTNGLSRAGSTVALRLDSEDVEVATQVAVEDPPKTHPAPAAPQLEARADMADTKKTIRIDAVEYQLDSDTARQAIEKKIADVEARADALTKERDTLQGKHDEVVKERDTLKQRVDGIDAEIEQRAEQRAKLRTDAAKVLGEDELPSKPAEGKSLERTLMEAVVRKDNAELELAGKSDDYVRARFEAAVERADAEPRRSPITTERRDAFTPASAPPSGGSPHNLGRRPPPDLNSRYRRTQ